MAHSRCSIKYLLKEVNEEMNELLRELWRKNCFMCITARAVGWERRQSGQGGRRNGGRGWGTSSNSVGWGHIGWSHEVLPSAWASFQAWRTSIFTLKGLICKTRLALPSRQGSSPSSGISRLNLCSRRDMKRKSSWRASISPMQERGPAPKGK